jgi:hypothetical protein
MPLPSLYVSEDKPREWSVRRAAMYGAALGLLIGLFKSVDPLHQGRATGAVEIVGAITGFAVLVAGAAALRNAIARRMIWPNL